MILRAAWDAKPEVLKGHSVAAACAAGRATAQEPHCHREARGAVAISVLAPVAGWIRGPLQTIAVAPAGASQ